MTDIARRKICRTGRAGRFVSLTLLLALPGCGQAQPTDNTGSLVLERTIPLAGVSGRIDHLAADPIHHRIFVAELGNGSVDVVNLDTATTRHITGLYEPQGVGYLPDRDEIVVASGGDGSVRFYNGASLAQTGVLMLGRDADNVRIDPTSGQVVVG